LETTVFKRQAAIIGSMTKAERKNPDLLKASRKKRVAAGSGTTVQDVNKLLKQFDDMSTMMKRMNKAGGQAAMLRQMQAAMNQPGMPKGGRRPF
jgi:signal recognition particle subunit SRP54